MKKIKIIASLACAGLLGSSMPSQAASIYAVSYTNVTGFSITGATNNVSVSGFSFSNAAAADSNGNSVANVDLGMTGSDTAASCIGDCTSYNNQFYSHPHSISDTDFIYADAVVTSTDINGGLGAASSIAEGYISDNLDFAFATGSNSLTNATINVGSGGANFQFSFILDNYMELSGDGYGTAWSSLSLSIDNNSIGSLLNETISANSSSSSGTFSTSNISLTEGTHYLSISMDNGINITPVPVPAAVWLFGSGLIGLASIARRRKQ
ncbi:MAG: VPLPA-CTERM sorting domain-containing protein [Gammaproteobacteria bacterium]|nr:VPLPA-CTERM sorting domain-containing protein [Gammaproteobacteria bacterium]